MNWLRWLLVVIMIALAVDNALEGDWSRAVAFAALAVANFALSARPQDDRNMRGLAIGGITVALVLLALRWLGVAP